ncbi:hypothetical protein [Methylocystis sp. S23]
MSIAELEKAVARIRMIRERLIEAERNRPDRYAHNVKNVRLDIYINNDDARAALKSVQAELEVSERKRGEAERDAALSALAMDLESLRAVLPQLAAAASIEIGVIARDLAHEASAGRMAR